MAEHASTSDGRPLTWVPSAYFLEGLPYVLVNVVSVPLYKALGVGNTEIALYTSSLGLIWAFKALWSPLVDGISTRRTWAIGMQGLMAPVLVAIALALPMSGFLQITVVLFGLLAVLSATYDIAADGYYMLALDEGQQSAWVGWRSAFYRGAFVFGEGAMVALAGGLASYYGLETTAAWSVALCVAAGLLLLGALYHAVVMPRPASDVPRPQSEALGTTLQMFRTFLLKDGMVAGVFFIVFFRFAENHMAKILPLFLLDDVEKGGLGLSEAEYGLAKGTIGILALTVGGILGGLAINRHGLKAWLWPMVIALNVPDALYVYLAWAQPQSFPLVASFIGLESFGYGFGFTAYLMFLIHLADGEYKTAHYAFATGLMALAVWAASAWSGWAQEQLGYFWFFVWVCALTLPGALVAWLVNVPPDYGKHSR